MIKCRSRIQKEITSSPMTLTLLVKASAISILVDVVCTAHSRRGRGTRVAISPILRGVGTTTTIVRWVVGLRGKYNDNIYDTR